LLSNAGDIINFITLILKDDVLPSQKNQFYLFIILSSGTNQVLTTLIC